MPLRKTRNRPAIFAHSPIPNIVCPTMGNEVHVHEIMQMMIESGKSYSRASLKAEIEQRFGADVRYHTCSLQGLDAAQAIDFMEMRGKFVPADGGGFSMPAENRCDH